MVDFKEESPVESGYGTDPEFELESRKRKSKSPSLAKEHEAKRVKEVEDTDDIAKQYKKFQAAPKFNLNSEELYCVCRKPDHGGELMISCDGCEEWFHFKCMKINLQNRSLIDRFFCKFCQWKGKGMTRWNRKCRMPGCLRPIRKEAKSKYCSHDCGVRYLKLNLVTSSQLGFGDIKFVIDFCANYDDMVRLGKDFPELPEVLSLEMEKLPQSVREKLIENEKVKQQVQMRHKASTLKGEYLQKIREKIKIINERLQLKVDPEEGVDSAKKGKKKKTKSKKVDFCLFDKKFDDDLLVGSYEAVVKCNNTYEAFKSEIDQIVDSYDEDGFGDFESLLCLEDRRKCLRHNGWFSLLSDRVWKQLTELQAVLEKLESERAETLREYSTLVYEKDV